MLGQSTIIAVVLITGIVIALTGAAYIWSAPLLEKSTSLSTLQTATTFILNVNEGIIDIANQQGGERTFDIPTGAVTVIRYDPSSLDPDNILRYEFTVSQPLVEGGGITYLGDTSFADTFGEQVGIFPDSRPSILSMRGEAIGRDYKMIIEDLFRARKTLTAPIQQFQIVLNKDFGGSQAGTSSVTIRYDTTEPLDTIPPTTLTLIRIIVA